MPSSTELAVPSGALASRVSSSRPGAMGMRREPLWAFELVENQPNTSTMTCAVPVSLGVNSLIVSLPSVPGLTMLRLGTTWLVSKLTIDAVPAGAPAP